MWCLLVAIQPLPAQEPAAPSGLVLEHAEPALMAIDVTVLTSGNASGNANAVTASVSPAANRLILAVVTVAVDAGIGDNGTARTDVSVSGCGLTWVRVFERVHAVRRVAAVFRAMGTPSSGAITISYLGPNTRQDQTWAILECSGVDTGGTDGSAAIGTPGYNFSGSGTSANATAGDTQAAGDETLAVLWQESNNDATPEAGWATLAEQSSSNTRRLEVSWTDGGTDNAPTWTWTGTSGWMGFAVVLFAGETGGEELTASLADGISLGDTLGRSMAMGRSMADTVSFADSLDRTAAFYRALADAAALDDTLGRSSSFARALDDAITLGDSLSAAIVIARHLADALSLGDSASRQLALSRTLAEAVILAEQLGGAQALTRALTDTLALSEALSGSLSGSLARTLSDAIVLGDSATASAALVRTLADAVALSDSTTTAAIFVRLVSDGLSITDALTAASLLTRTLGENIALQDQLLGFLGGLDVRALHGVIESLRLRATLAEQRLRGSIDRA